MPAPFSAYFANRAARDQTYNRMGQGIGEAVSQGQAALSLWDELAQRAERKRIEDEARKAEAAQQAAQEARTVESFGWQRAAQPDVEAARKLGLTKLQTDLSNTAADRDIEEQQRMRKTALEALPGFVQGARAEGLTPDALLQRARGVPTLGGISDDAEVRAEVARQVRAEQMAKAKADADAAAFAEEQRQAKVREAQGWGAQRIDRERIQADAKARADAAKAKADAEERKRNDPMDIDKPMRKEILENEIAYRNMTALESAMNDAEIGMLPAFKYWIEEKVNFNDPEQAAFRAQVMTQINDYIKRTTGSAMGADEEKRLMSVMPSYLSSPDVFRAVIRQNIQNIVREREAIISAAEQTKMPMPNVTRYPMPPNYVPRDKTDADLDDLLNQ